MKLSTTVFATLTILSMTTAAYAAGSDSTKPPKPTKTTEECEEGLIWDKKLKECVEIVEGHLSDDALYDAARELAYDGQFETALKVLNVAANQMDPRILNYKGFANRKAGRMDIGMAYYEQALEIDPDYILARSYMGQALIQQGDVVGAFAQLKEIEARGGAETWAFASLDMALRGIETNY